MSSSQSRKITAVIAALMFAVMLVSSCSSAGSESVKSEPVEISRSTFPDEGFRGYVSQQFDEDADGVLSAEEVGQVRDINVYGDGVSSFEGVQYFVNLTSFTYTENVYVTEIDLTQNTQLNYVEVRGDCDSVVMLPGGVQRSDTSCDENVTLVLEDEEEESEEPADDEGAGEESSDGFFSSSSSASVCASSWIQNYEGTWYSDGVPCTMESVRPVSMDGVEPLNVGSSSILIYDDYVYYVEGSTASLGTASLWREPLGGGSAELLIDDEMAASDFYLVNDRIYFMAALGDWDEESAAASVSIDGGEIEYYDGVDWILGASDENDRIFVCDYEEDAVESIGPRMSDSFTMNIQQYSVWDFGQASDDVYYYVGISPENSDLRAVFVDPDGYEINTVWSSGGYASAMASACSWSDGTSLYLAGTDCITQVDLESQEIVDQIDVNMPYECEGDVSPLFVDDSVIYYAVTFPYDEYASDPVTAGVCRYDRETGETEIVDAWYEQ